MGTKNENIKECLGKFNEMALDLNIFSNISINQNDNSSVILVHKFPV